MKLSDFVSVISGELLKDAEFETLEYITGTCSKKYLTFLENKKYLNKINKNISCLIVTKELLDEVPDSVQGIIIAEDPRKSFIVLHNFLADNPEYNFRKEFDSFIGENCNISPFAVISKKNVWIGNNVYIAPFCVIKENVQIGDNCIIHENCVIGGKSFNFVKTNDDEVIKMVDLGTVILKDNVEICPFCSVAGSPLPTDATILEEHVKLDVMVHVGHGTHIGARTKIPAGAKIGGNCMIGEDGWIGLNATISNRINVGDNARISLGSVVTKDVQEGETVTGNFAVAHKRFLNELREANKKAELGKYLLD